MLYLKLGWRNLWRGRRRTFIQLAAIAGAVFIATWFHNFQIGVYKVMIDEGTRMGSGHIDVCRKGYLLQRKTEMTLDAGAVLRAVGQVDGVVAAYPRLTAPGLARSSRESRGVAALGLDIEREAPANPLLQKKRIVEGGLPRSGKEALVGADLARELGLKLRKKFVWMGQGADGKIVSKLYRISGLVRTGLKEVDSGTLIVQREGLSRVLGRPDAAHEVAVMLSDHREVEEMLPKLRAAVAGVPGAEAVSWEEAMPNLANIIRFDHTSGCVMYGLIFLLVGIGAVNTMLMSVVERKREFGVIRALGLGPRGVVRMVAAEAFVLGLLGVAAGWALTGLVELYSSTHGLDFSRWMSSYEAGGLMVEPIFYTAWDWRGALVMAAAMILITLVSALYPARHVVKTSPAEAMRSY